MRGLWGWVLLGGLVLPIASFAGPQEGPRAGWIRCLPLRLVPVDPAGDPALVMPLTELTEDRGPFSVHREYDVPGTVIPLRVAYTMTLKRGWLEVSKTFLQKREKGWALVMTFYSPFRLELPLAPATIYSLKSNGDSAGEIPPTEIECGLKTP
jgi:hypothetical protein